MGLRFRAVLVVLSLLAIAALAVPLALSLADRRTAALAVERDRQLAALADAAAMPDAPLQRLVDRYFEVYGEGLPPELRHFTSVFNSMAQVVRASLHRQRRLIADASHQLRNPLAAVRLRADSLEDYVAEAGWPTYGSMTAELDRFENLLAQLLRLARAEQVSGSRQVGLSAAVAESTELADVIEERMAFWQPILDSEDQQLQYPLGSSRPCRATRTS